MIDKKLFYNLASNYGTPLLIIDHNKIRKNYLEFREKLPRVQVYYAVKANSEIEIIKTLYDLGSSFDVASLSEFNLVLNLIKNLEPKKLQNFIWNNIIYANTVKKPDSLHFLNLYKPLLTYDSVEEMEKIKIHCPEAGLLLRIKVSDEGSVVKFANKFGIDPKSAPDLIEKTIKTGLGVEGISFHAGSQCNNPQNFVKALQTVAEIFAEVERRGYVIGETVTTGNPIKIVDIGGGFPVQYNGNEQSFSELTSLINKELDRLFPADKTLIIAEPGRFMVANAGTAIASVVLAKHSTEIPCYHLDDGLYHTYSAIMYDHLEADLKSFKDWEKPIESKVFGPTCDGLDELSENSYIHNSKNAFLPLLSEGDLIYQENIGAYSNASATSFNGFAPAKIIHINN
jgi:ornithine decarboxylase